MQLPVRAMATLLYRSRLFNYLAAATPGLQEMVTMGKVWELAQDERRDAGDEPHLRPGDRRRAGDRPRRRLPADARDLPRDRARRAAGAPGGPDRGDDHRPRAHRGRDRRARREEMAVNESVDARVGAARRGRASPSTRSSSTALYPQRFSTAELERIEPAPRAAARRARRRRSRRRSTEAERAPRSARASSSGCASSPRDAPIRAAVPVRAARSATDELESWPRRSR